METSGNIKQVFSDYLHDNKAFWDRFSSAQSELSSDYIAVDAMVDFPSYILGNLIIAKYLQSFTGCRILAIIRNPEQLARWKDLFISFSVDEAFFAMDEKPFPYNFNIADIIKEKEGPGLRERLLRSEINGMPVGDLIYDAYLRDTGEPTVFQMNSTLEAYIRTSISFYDRYNLLFKNKKIKHCILGHTVYLLYGVLARVAVQHGAIVYGRKTASTPLTIMRYENIGDFPMGELDIGVTQFEKIYTTRKEQAIDFADNFLSKRFAGEAAGPWGAFIAYSKDRCSYNRIEFKNKCQINNDKPIVFLMSHAFSDSPHCYSVMLYHDYFDWLQSTLDIASTIKDVNWIVKPHPEDKLYLSTINHAAKLGIEYSAKYENIFLCPDDLNSASIYGIADSLVTVRGTCALEFSALGTPCIVTGMGYFSKLGFLHESIHREQYIQTLANIPKMGNLDQLKMDQAKTAIFFYQYVLMVDCIFVPGIHPGWWVPFNAVQFWDTARQSLSTFNVLDDPLYKNFKIQFEHSKKQMLRFDEFSELINS